MTSSSIDFRGFNTITCFFITFFVICKVILAEMRGEDGGFFFNGEWDGSDVFGI